ncbi:hypothetical protein ABTK87_19640, partial [Acinetobacter baumannii]
KQCPGQRPDQNPWARGCGRGDSGRAHGHDHGGGRNGYGRRPSNRHLLFGRHSIVEEPSR